MFTQLATFKMVYEVQNFSLAAQQLFIAQPTVSSHIQQLEKYFGQKLFQRQGRKDIQPTEAAKVLYRQVNQLLDDWQSITNTMSQTIPEARYQVKIGASQTFGIYRLPPIIQALNQQFQNGDFNITMDNSEAILKALSAHKLDFGFIEKPIATSGVSRYEYGADQLVRCGDLTSGTWLIREPGSGVAHYTKMYLQSANIKPAKVLQVANNELIIQLLKLGLGQTILSDQAKPKGVPHEVLPPAYLRHFYFLSRDHLSANLQQVAAYLLKRSQVN
ncbi:MAG: LysR family transcriptional regulator [Lactobacillus sp.]|jgi:DNA-binding transcriptional LysR family regulator|nr:LysR family transcriptional regulator [Lactobacillus sp.]